MATYKLNLQLLNPQNLPLSNFTVQVWVKEQRMGEALSNAEGKCTLSLTVADKGTKAPALFAYLLVYSGSKWVYGEKDKPQYALEGSELNLALTIKTRQADLIPLTLNDFRQPSKDLSKLLEVQRAFIAGKFNSTLQAAVQQAVGEAIPVLKMQVLTQTFNYTEWQDKTLGQVIEEKVLPKLKQQGEEQEAPPLAESSQHNRPVREILHLELPLLKNPIFYEAVQVLRTTELADMMLSGQPHVAEYLLERALDWERASTTQWEALAKEGIVSEAGKNLLQRGFALSRFTGGQTALVGRLMQNTTDLSKLATLDAAQLLAHIKAAGNETPNGEAPEEYAANLEKLAQRNFPSVFFLERTVQRLPASKIIDNAYRHLSVQGEAGQKHLKSFIANNSGFDLRTANFFEKDKQGKWAHSFKDIPAKQQDGVRKQMMAFQRVTRLAGSYEAQEALLAAGLDSSSEIMQRKPAELQTMLSPSLSQATIADIVVSAEQQYQVVVNSAVAIQGISSSQSIGFAVDNYPQDLINQLHDIDGYSEMFGSQDYCECTHCKSIFGPAAYFVDLMKFTEENVILMDWDINKFVPLTPNPETHPISLRTRRPDLWHLELTCENTNAVVPYLLIINEIKQRYIAEVMGAILGGKPAKEVDIWAEFARPFVSTITLGFQQTRPFVQANTWKNSFRLPFNRPFEESQILLKHFGVTYTEMLQALRVSDPTRLAQAYLGVSAEEWQVLVTPDSSLEDLRGLRFGFPPVDDSSFTLKHCSVGEFQRATGLNRADVEFLLSGKSSLYQILNTVKLVRNPIPGEIQQYEEWIEGLENKDVLDFIHRFLRLKQRLPWTLRELDLVVSKAGKLSPDNIVEIAEILEMQRVLQLTVEEAVAFQWAIPDTPLYTRTVYNELLNASVEVPVKGMLSSLFDLSKLPLDGSIESLLDPQKLPFLLQGWGTTESEFEQLYRLLLGADEMKLDLTSVSLFYRLHRMAKVFGISGEEMGYLIKLSGTWAGTSIAGWTLEMAKTMEIVRQMPLSLHELWFVLTGEKTTKIDFHYQGDAKRQSDAEEAAQQLTTNFVQDKRLAIDAVELLKKHVPPNWLTGTVDPISDDLLDSMFFRKTSDGYFQVIKVEPLSFDNIISRILLKLKPKQKTVTKLDIQVGTLLADVFNAEWSKIRNQVFGEHLGLLFKTPEPIITGMLFWSADAGKVLAEAQANFANTTSTYSTVELVKALPTLERLGLLFDKIGLDAEDALQLKHPDHPALFIQLLAGNPPSDGNTINVIQQLATYARFKQKAADTAGIKAYRDLLSTTITKDTPIAAFSQLIASILGCETNQVIAAANILKAQDNLTLLFNPSLLRQIEAMVQVFKKLGIYELTVLNAFKDNTYAAALQYEKALRTAFRAQYTTEAAYEKAWDPYENRIQELRRDVLCAFLLALDQQNNFQDTGDLYAYFLVDVEMSGCSRVSRILAGILSLQLYVHRVIMGLELTKDMTPSDGVKDIVQAFLGKLDIIPKLDTQAKYRKQWEWRKNYRVWEANRKVFLYPENWIEPELRNDKSPLFKTLEDELLQQKISIESAEQAYKQYLKGYLEVANLLIGGAYYDHPTKCYFLFGRTQVDPYQYYYRKYNSETKFWTAWKKIELAISSPHVSSVIYRNQLYLFWVDIITQEKTKFSDGNSQFVYHSHEVMLNYSILDPNDKWLQPQKIKMGEEPVHKFWGLNDFGPEELKDNEEIQKAFNRDYYFSTKSYRKIYPSIINGKIHIQYLRESIQRYWNGQKLFYLYYCWVANNLNLFSNTLDEEYTYKNLTNERLWAISPDRRLCFQQNILNSGTFFNDGDADMLADICVRNHKLAAKAQGLNSGDNYSKSQGKILGVMLGERTSLIASNFSPEFMSNEQLSLDKKPALHMVHSSKSPENGADYLFEYDNQTYFIHSLPTPVGIPLKTLSRISTSITKELIEKFTLGLEEFLSLNTQRLPEYPFSLNYEDSNILYRTVENSETLDFTGAHGLYFRELFFHIPFLIADHLNAEGKYKEADYWYRKIFDPSASFDPGPQGDPKDRYWRFMEFRAQTFPGLRDILTDAAAISAYENDPFNPHAIARVRSGPYQKSIVTKYVDNLIDWGDSLFRRDTWESNTEAMLLYQLAHDILGERPQKTGPCESAIDTNNCGCVDPKTTYAKLKGLENQPFVYSIENWVSTPDFNLESAKVSVLSGDSVIGYEDSIAAAQAMGTRSMNSMSKMREPSYAVDFGQQLFSKNVFCIPGNEKIFDYWDRVEDRQYKLRHCMNIDGVKRSLALFQPPIDPALLVAAFAAGLSVEDVLNSLYGDLPAYRFSYLVEKAKAFAGTVQSFGGALLSALEKKDSEALTLLRSTQEQNILKMTKDVKKKAIEEAKANLQSTVEGMVNTMNRVTQYTEWIEENLNGWERTQQISLHTASVLHATDSIIRIIAAITANIPQVGSPPAIVYGGIQISSSADKFATSISALASLASTVSSSAGLEASFQRRAQDWKFQLKTAEQEIKQVQQQIAAATIRLAIAEKDLEIHEKQIEQAAEVHDFYKNKFTGLGLYNYMAKRLNSLHRMAFNIAIDMAKQAEAAYKFETGDETYFEISGGTFWDASRVGLLSGESLTLELQKLETNFINWNRRQMEIRQSFSMLMIDPEKLLELRKEGKCTFTIPEWAFDMQYPGHYCRRIVSVQITIPCVAGPHHNIAATLAMNKGSLKKGKTVTEATTGFPFRGSSLIATSNANNDGGQFELNFRDERFLPFEGAGAVNSEWVLELPDTFRTFDYETISDVIFHLSYRSKYDDVLKGTVEQSLLATISNLGGFKRLISLKQEFPDLHFQLSQGQTVSLLLEKHLFPLFAQRLKIQISEVAFGQPTSATLSGQPTSPTLLDIPITITPNNLKDDVVLIVSYKLSLLP